MNWARIIRVLRGGLIRTLRCDRCRFKCESWIPWDAVGLAISVDYFAAAQVRNHPEHTHPDWDSEVAS